MAEGHKSMEVDSSDGSNCNLQPSKEKILVPIPVAGGSSGEGLPYAPEDWPLPGDMWKWKVGKRKSASGHWLDRYIFPPSRLQYVSNGKPGFYSRLSLKDYIQKKFPEADVDAFFASFIWKIPSSDHTSKEDVEKSICIYSSPRSLGVNGCSKSGPVTGAGDCKAGNKMCNLRVKARGYALAAKTCDICCSETGFCRDCCCVLCCKTVDWAYGGYSFIRCEAAVDENFICGHVGHIECALRAYMAGTVGGCIGLNTEYFCRRCDNKSDLIPHVNKLIKTCESLDSQDDIKKILNLGFCILRGSEQERAKNLRNRIALVMAKLKHGVCLGDIWKDEDTLSSLTTGDNPLFGNEVVLLGTHNITRHYGTSMDSSNDAEPPRGNDAIDGETLLPRYITANHDNVSVKLEDEVDQVLRELKRSQESEYRIAEQKLYAQKDFLLSLYQLLEAERSELAGPVPLANGSDRDSDALLTNVINRVDQIKREEVKLQQMMKAAKGFGETPKNVLTAHFGLPSSD